MFLLLVGSGFRIAIQADRPFSKLFAAGLTTIIGVQTFVIIGGVTTRLQYMDSLAAMNALAASAMKVPRP